MIFRKESKRTLKVYKNSCFFLIVFVFIPFQIISSQTVKISGVIEGDEDLENILIENKTSNISTITNIKGEFKINVEQNDTLIFSSVQYKLRTIIINEEIILKRHITILLESRVFQLDNVTVGQKLTGLLDSDIRNIKRKQQINFYNVGVPGYRGEPFTLNERRLYEATNGGDISVTQILNSISGRTKYLKHYVYIEKRDKLLNFIMSKYSKDFWSAYSLDDNLKSNFFYFCSEDVNFFKRCENKNEIEILGFLREKLIQYKSCSK